MNDIREARLGLKISQVELARRLGVTTSTVWRWEHGHVAYPKSALLAIAAMTADPTPTIEAAE